MDHSVTYSYRRIDTGQTENKTIVEDILYFEPIDTHEREHRGNLLLVIQLVNPSNTEIDLSKLKGAVCDSIRDNYYQHNETGSPLEALETSVNRGITYATDLSQNKVQIKVGGYSLWGTTLSYVNPQLMPLGMRRDNEYFELDAPLSGIEEIKDDDVIMASTPTFYESVTKFFIRDKASILNRELIEELKQYVENINATDKIPTCIAIHYCSIKPVPGDEEIIEIQYIEDKITPTKKPHLLFTRSKNILASITSKLTIKKPNITIYLKTPSTPKQKKMFLLVVVVLLLGLSIYGTLYLRNRKTDTILFSQSLSKAQNDLSQAQDLAVLNPVESLQLVDSATQELGQVKGARQVDQAEISRLENQANDIREIIYQRKQAAISEAQISAENSNKILQVTSEGIQNLAGVLIVTPDPDWLHPISVNTYLDNFYVLDDAANAIWKYIPSGTSYAGAYRYLTEATDLHNAIDLAIDGSIYVLTNDSVTKYTLGKKDTFSLKGVFPEFNQNSKIATNPESNFIYISTDQGICVFDKNGNYQKTYIGNLLDSVQRMYLFDADKLILFQANNRWWQINPLPE